MLRILLFWALFPFVLPQALRLRQNAPRVTGAGGPKKGSMGSGKPLQLIAVGDSIISGVGAPVLAKALVGQTARQLSERLDARIHWAAYGGIGARSHKVLNQLLPRISETAADFIVLSVGVNDITALSRLSAWERQLEALLSTLADRFPDAVVAVAGIPPLGGFPLLPQPLRAVFGLRAVSFDIASRRIIARHPLAVHVPLDFDPHPDKFSPDGFHPSEESYAEFGHMVAQRIADRCGAGAVGTSTTPAAPPAAGGGVDHGRGAA
ncbi:MAG: SGNH/GDSL hydrolase family protein [Desulfosarcinaceae bacterium]|nr:SGNH/GDSL hydrolase family protein [Desulfosarcinaceae bacterium]